jgi:aminoglycoside phosphotransferase (APT) family kinase protein
VVQDPVNVTAADLLGETALRAELLAAVRPYGPADGAWTHIGGYLGRSVVLQCGEVVLKCFLHVAQTKWQRELRAYAFLQGSALPVPRLLASGQLSGGVPWLLVSRMPGQVAVDVLDAMTVDERLQVFEAAGALLARLHALPVDARLEEGPLALAHEAYARRLTRRMHAYSQAATGSAQGLQIARSWAQDDLSRPPPALVCAHGDFSMRNLLVRRCGAAWELCGLIDFERAEPGEAAADLARVLLSCSDWREPALHALLDAYTSRVQAPSRDRVLLHIGLIVLDAASWAQDQDPAYFAQLLGQVERLHVTGRLRLG